MKLWEALKLLDEGKKVRRKTWDRIDYLYKEDDEIKKNLSRNLVLELADLTYVDWEEYDNRKELPEQLKWVKDAKEFFTSDEDCVEYDCAKCLMRNKLNNGRTICSQLDECIRDLSLIYKI